MFVAFAFSVMVLTTFSVSAFAYADDTEQMLLWAYSIWNNPEMGQYLPD